MSPRLTIDQPKTQNSERGRPAGIRGISERRRLAGIRLFSERRRPAGIRGIATAFASVSLLCQTAAFAGIDDSGLYSGKQPIDILRTRSATPIELNRRQPTLGELIQRAPLVTSQLQPIPIQGLRIAGLAPKSVEALGFNYFVVVNNSHYTRMADIYRDSRLAGKSNFVTADSIIHPYTAFANRVLAETAVKQMTPDMLMLLNAMLKVSLDDYKQAQDADVREDLVRNIAYLSVGIKLLNPKFEVPAVGNAADLVSHELKTIAAGKRSLSKIFDREEDFSWLRPIGWYKSSPDLENFYRCREWLARMAFPIADVTTGSGEHTSNNFRRSVLLFRSLDLAEHLGKPATDLWNRMIKANALFASPSEEWRERTLYPSDYKTVFTHHSADLKVTLNALSEPFYRTKLMLAIRRQKPVNFASTSIFELAEDTGNSAAPANFRLFPVIGEPEFNWLRKAAGYFPQDKTMSASWPIGLLDMYVWGAPQAGNILSDNLYFLDPEIAKALPELQRCVLRRLPSGLTQPMESRRWKVLSTYFRPYAGDTIPNTLKSDVWLTRKLESAFGAWIDNLTAISPVESKSSAAALNSDKDVDCASGEAAATADAITNMNTPVTNPNAPRAPGATPAAEPMRRVGKGRPYHFLEPSTDVFRRLNYDAQKMVTDLTELGYFNEAHRGRFSDFMRLFQRLEKIAETELRGQQLSNLDRRLLGNIDLILEKIDQPLPSVLSVSASTRPGAKPEPMDRGFNLALGRPGQLFMVLQNPHTMEWTLARGAVYSYYEMPFPALNDAMWQHKMEAGFFHPPGWTDRFDMIQPTKTATKTE